MEFDNIYLKKEYANSLNEKENVSLIQLFRIINSLKAWMTIIPTIGKNGDVLACDVTEIYFTIIGVYNEALKTFLRDVYPIFNKKVKNSILNGKIIHLISEVKSHLKNSDNPIYSVVDYVRHKVAFHFDQDFIAELIKKDAENQDEEDVKVGFTANGVLSKARFTIATNYIIENVFHKSGQDMGVFFNYMNWIKEEIMIKKIDAHCNLFEDFAYEIIGDNIYVEKEKT